MWNARPPRYGSSSDEPDRDQENGAPIALHERSPFKAIEQAPSSPDGPQNCAPHMWAFDARTTTLRALTFRDPVGRASANSSMATERTPIIDREHLAAFREGRRDVLERVYREHVTEVIAFLRIGFMYTTNTRPTRFPGARDSFELEALVQEVFTRAFDPRARLAYDGVRPYGAFLCGIARNLVLDKLRRDARHGEVLADPGMLDAMPAVESNADRALSSDEQRVRELVVGFLDAECDDRDRKLYQLRYDRELSQVDAASAAGLTRIQVRRWEAKFRGRLLRFLKRADYVRDR